ncbi:UPF0175 family protein [Candidatus Woesearchaeota archaeon]|nr:UPF0175 family protein [Candidatus Woesearchaeota archaeon]
MAEVTLSTRIPPELEKELKDYLAEEGVDRSIAVRKLLSSGLQKWRQERALHLLEEGRATFSKAAEIAGTDVWEFAEAVKDSQISWIRQKPEELRRELADL